MNNERLYTNHLLVTFAGDNILTAVNVGRKCEIIRPGKRVVRMDAATPVNGDKLDVEYLPVEFRKEKVINTTESAVSLDEVFRRRLVCSYKIDVLFSIQSKKNNFLIFSDCNIFFWGGGANVILFENLITKENSLTVNDHCNDDCHSSFRKLSDLRYERRT